MHVLPFTRNPEHLTLKLTLNTEKAALAPQTNRGFTTRPGTKAANEKTRELLLLWTPPPAILKVYKCKQIKVHK